MMRSRGRGLALLVPVLFLLPTGCGPTVHVKGRVTLGGKPVPGATVLFVPEPGGDGRPASGWTDDAGEFQLTTYRPKDGAVRGTYRVVVRKTEGVATPPDPDHASRARFRDHLKRIAARERKRPLISPVYGDAASTPLRCTVPADSTLTLELSGDPRP
jgi:hypothetical protein